jgi:hypothetical protein
VIKEFPDNNSALFAAEELKFQGVKVTQAVEKPAVTLPWVVIHFPAGTKEANVANIAGNLQNALVQRGIKVEKPRPVDQWPGSGEIRYFRTEDLENAARIKNIAERELARQRFLISLKITQVNLKVFDGVKPGLVEVWLPPLTARPNQTSGSPSLGFDNPRLYNSNPAQTLESPSPPRTEQKLK